MKANELRIGNYIQTKYEGVSKVININSEGFDYVDCKTINFKALRRHELEADCFPIPLNEDWLFKFGLTKANGYHYKFFCGYLIFKNGVCFFKYYDLEIKLDYVHQLQNLYFALTGEELTIKL